MALRLDKDTEVGARIDRYSETAEDSFERLRGVVVSTSMRSLDWLQRIGGFQQVFGKFENHQRTGSFKFRGAYNRLLDHPAERPVIAASAGNHGLAIAEAAKELGIQTTICIPANASPLKKSRLAAYPHSIIPNGASLEEATAYAKGLASTQGWDFISPYNDEGILCGQGTLGIEMLEQVPDLDAIIVPVGGGGLICGVAAIAKKINPKIKIIGVEPETYASLSTSLERGAISRVVNYPTFADGLAVNLEEDSITFDIARELVDEWITVSEEELAAAALALLHHESQMVEASGAAGIAAMISGKIAPDAHQKIGVILSGGNLTTSGLSKIMHYPFRDPNLMPFLNVHGEHLEHQVPLRGADFTPMRKAIAPTSGERIQSGDVKEDQHYLNGRFEDIKSIFDNLRERLKEYLGYCKIEGLRPDTSATRAFQELDKIREGLNGGPVLLEAGESPSEYNQTVTTHLQRYRALVHIALSASMILDWRSASYGQSWDTMFFHVDSQGNPGVNYNRYESSQLGKVEKNLAEVLGVDQTRNSLLLTSSGMAAYSLLESYLIRYVLQPGDNVLIPHYIYFETDEQISKIPWLNIEHTDTHKKDEIIGMIKSRKPKIVFLDPLTNTLELEMTDIEGILAELAQEDLEEDIYFVIDGTMLSGQLNPQAVVKNNPKIKVLYYDSCSKYLQLGLDISMGGLAVVPIETAPIFDRLRRNSGAIMYDASANIFPIYDRETHLKRMKRFGQNAILISELIAADPQLSQEVQINYPLLPSHKDHEIAAQFDSVGGIMTFQFYDQNLTHRDALNSFIEIALKKASEYNISLTKGVSFGFSIPRISAASAMAENSPPFLRLSVGDRSYAETQLLAESLIAAFKEFIVSNSKL